MKTVKNWLHMAASEIRIRNYHWSWGNKLAVTGIMRSIFPIQRNGRQSNFEEAVLTQQQTAQNCFHYHGNGTPSLCGASLQYENGPGRRHQGESQSTTMLEFQ